MITIYQATNVEKSTAISLFFGSAGKVDDVAFRNAFFGVFNFVTSKNDMLGIQSKMDRTNMFS